MGKKNNKTIKKTNKDSDYQISKLKCSNCKKNCNTGKCYFRQTKNKVTLKKGDGNKYLSIRCPHCKKHMKYDYKIIKKGGKKELFEGQLNSEVPNSYLIKVTERHANNNKKLSSADNSFSKYIFIAESHNCYTYFLNLKSRGAYKLCLKDLGKHNMCRRGQPGYFAGYPRLTKDDYKCPVIEERTLADNPEVYRIPNIETKCKPTHYKGAIVVAPGRDYHYYRLNDDGQWSHKPGYKPSTIYDSKGERITNPEKASRDYGGTLNYKDFCGYVCVPRNDYKKNMTHKINKNE